MKDLQISMIPLGGATNVFQIMHPFTIKRGWKKIHMTTEDAEWLCGQLTELLGREDCRHPKVINF